MLESSPSIQILSKSDFKVHQAGIDRPAHTRHIRPAAAGPQLTQLAAYLPADERALVVLIADEGRTRVEVARLLHARPRTISNRYARVVARMRSPEFVLCVRHAASWPRDLRLVAERCVLAACPLRRAAQDLGMSIHTIRRLREQIQCMAQGVRLTSVFSAHINKGGDTWRGNTPRGHAQPWRHSA